MPTSPAGGGRRRPPGTVSPPGRAAPRVRGFVCGPPGLAEVEVEVVAESSGRGQRAAGCGQMPRRRRRRSRSCPPPPSLPSFREAKAGHLLSSRARGRGGPGGARGGYLEPGDAVVPGGEPGLAPPAAGPVAVRLVPVHHGRPRGGGGGPGLPLFTTNKHTQTRHHLPKTAWPPGRPMVRHRHGAGGHLADGQPGPGRERSGSGRPTGRGAPDGPTSELERLKCAEWHALATFITTERPPATPPGRSRVKMVAAPAGPHP